MKEPMGKALKDAPWNVWYDGGFQRTDGEGPAGEELPLHQEFDWAGRHWVLPALYRCEEGLVLDLCMEIDPEELRRFAEKWDLQMDEAEQPEEEATNAASEQEPIAAETAEQIAAQYELEQPQPQQHNQTPKPMSNRTRERRMNQESPFRMEVNPELWVNGRKLPAEGACGTSWNPYISRCNDETRFILEHYDLDGFQAWMIFRYRFPWTEDIEPLEQLSVTLHRDPAEIDGSSFTVTAPGEQIPFTLPTDGTQHTLIVESFEPVDLPETEEDWFPGWELPRYARQMTYTICPPIPAGILSLEDDAERDQAVDPDGKACYICMGYALDYPEEKRLEDGTIRYAAGSNLRNALVQSVTWQMVWKQPAPAPITLKLKME